MRCEICTCGCECRFVDKMCVVNVKLYVYVFVVVDVCGCQYVMVVKYGYLCMR
jgi:hypothetical protein